MRCACLPVYLNTSALNRPFDDLSSSRVRSEAEAQASSSLRELVSVGRVVIADEKSHIGFPWESLYPVRAAVRSIERLDAV